MTKVNRLLVVVAAAVACLCDRGQAAPSTQPAVSVQTIDRTRGQAEEAVRTLQASSAPLGDIFSRDPRLAAIVVVRNLRCRQAIQPLIALVDSRCIGMTAGTELRTPDIGDWYPAAAALAAIGKPAVAQCVWNLRLTSDQRRQACLCWVIRKIEGEEAARVQIAEAIAAEKDAARRENLEAAIKVLDEPKDSPAHVENAVDRSRIVR